MTDPRLDPPPGAWVRLLARIARALLPLPSAPPGLEEIRSVLVVRTDDRVGNALLTIPLLRGLQKALPRARVDLLLAARRAHVAEGLPDPGIDFQSARRGDVARNYADTTKARERLGWKAEIALHEGLRRTVRWALASHRAGGFLEKADRSPAAARH